jgi:hypothetical protein
MATADAAAQAGDTVRFIAGSYGSQSLSGTTKAVTFIGTGADTVLGSLNLGGIGTSSKVDNKVVDSFLATNGGSFMAANNDTIKNGTINDFTYIESSSYLTFDNIDFNGNHTTDDTIDIYEQDRSYQPNNHITINRSKVRGARASTAASHPDGIQFCNCSGTRGDSYHATNIVVSNSEFYDNECINLRTNPGTGLDLTGNVFSDSFGGGLSGCGSYSIDVIGAGGTMSYNTFLGGQAAQNNATYNNPMQYWTGNVGLGVGIQGCQVKNAVWSHNVWTGPACSSTDKHVTDLKLNSDGSLKPGSMAIAAGDSSNYPATDFNGLKRSLTPDAGAFKYVPTTANLWVVPSGGTASCTRQATPTDFANAPSSAKCSTIQAAYNAMSSGDANTAGDTAIIKSGTYSSATVNSGSKTKPVFIMVENGGTATVGGSTFVNLNNLVLDGTNGANGQGFDTTGGFTVGSNGGAPAQNMTVKGFKIHDAHGFIYMTGCSQVTISDIELANLQNEDGIQMANFTGQPMCTDVVFDNIFMHDFVGDCGVDHQDGIQIRSGSRIVFKNSRIFNLTNCGSQGFFANQEGDLGGNDTTLENTVIAGINGNAINFSSKGPQKMYNNTIDGGLNTCTPRTTTCSGVIMKNNILNAACAGINLFYARADNPSTDWANNITTSNCGHATDTVTPNFKAMFVHSGGPATSDYDYHLVAGAFAIDKGSTTDSPITDFDGDYRDSTPDVGADEYVTAFTTVSSGGGSPSDTTAPAVSLSAPTANATVSGASVTLSANASDAVGVTKVEFYVDGNLVTTDTSSPYLQTWNSQTVANGSHTIQAKAYDAANNIGTSTTVTVTSSNTTSCNTSSATWQNQSFASQTGNFNFDFDVTPNGTGLDGITGLSSGAVSGFSDLATAVRFNGTNTIDVRNGGSYTADTSVSYSAGTTYHFKMIVNVPNHTYSVTVTPSGGAQTALATNYAFRTEQASVTSLSNWTLFSDSGTHSVCNAMIGASSGGTTKTGDLNADSQVNIFDLSILLSNYSKTAAQSSNPGCDLNNDGLINIFDLSILLSNYGK